MRMIDQLAEASVMLKTVVVAAAPAIGPVVVAVLGYNVPILSAVLALVGVVLAAMLAPPPPRPLTVIQRIALMLLLAILAVSLAIGGTSSPVVSLCWAIGIGYSGLPIIAEIQQIVFSRTAQLVGDVAPSPTQPAIPEPANQTDTPS
jgi:hypothetical protein